MKSILDGTDDFETDGEKLEWLEGIVRAAEECLSFNRKGGFSAADVCGALWELGLDPGNE